nr:unnamed protein product [Leishmania braziliensis]
MLGVSLARPSQNRLMAGFGSLSSGASLWPALPGGGWTLSPPEWLGVGAGLGDGFDLLEERALDPGVPRAKGPFSLEKERWYAGLG